MKFILSIFLIALLSQGIVRTEAGDPTHYHTFRDACNISSAAFAAAITYTGPSPPSGWQDCVVSATSLLFCLDLSSEFARTTTPVACITPPYPYCPSLKGTTWGLLCDNQEAPAYTAATFPFGFKYCVGTTTALNACVDITAVNFATKLSFGYLRGIDEKTEEKERPVARFIEEAKEGEMVKTEEKMFPLLLGGEPLNHCIFQDGRMIGCRAVNASQYKDQTPYLGFTGVFFRDADQTQGYVPAIPTVSGLQYAMSSIFQFFTDNIFVSTGLTP